MHEDFITGNLPVLALRGLVIFPEQTLHFDIGRVKSAMALEEAMRHTQLLLLVPQKNIVEDDPGFGGLYPVGTVVHVKQILKSQENNIRVLVNGICRARITNILQAEPFMSATVERTEDVKVTENLHARALRREAKSAYGAYMELAERPAQTVQLRMIASEDTGFVADTIAQNSGIDYPDRAKLLCQFNPVKRLEHTLRLLQQEMQMP